MVRWMNTWIDEWINYWIDRQMLKQMNRWIARCMDKCINGCINSELEGKNFGQMYQCVMYVVLIYSGQKVKLKNKKLFLSINTNQYCQIKNFVFIT